MSIRALFAVCMWLIPQILLAETIPVGSKLDTRVREVKFVDGQVYVVRTALTRSTVVEFERGEKIVSIVAGDTSSFQFESVPGDRVFAIKPTAKNVATNVTVYTNRRSYYLHLKEGRNPFFVVRFLYPESKKKKSLIGSGQIVTNTNYGVSERNEITPQRIWDDGKFTYFKFDPAKPVPSIFKVTLGFERSVNSQMLEGRIVRVSGVSRQWALRLGAQEVCAVELSNDK